MHLFAHRVRDHTRRQPAARQSETLARTSEVRSLGDRTSERFPRFALALRRYEGQVGTADRVGVPGENEPRVGLGVSQSSRPHDVFPIRNQGRPPVDLEMLKVIVLMVLAENHKE